MADEIDALLRDYNNHVNREGFDPALRQADKAEATESIEAIAAYEELIPSETTPSVEREKDPDWNADLEELDRHARRMYKKLAFSKKGRVGKKEKQFVSLMQSIQQTNQQLQQQQSVIMARLDVLQQFQFQPQVPQQQQTPSEETDANSDDLIRIEITVDDEDPPIVHKFTVPRATFAVPTGLIAENMRTLIHYDWIMKVMRHRPMADLRLETALTPEGSGMNPRMMLDSIMNKHIKLRFIGLDKQRCYHCGKRGHESKYCSGQQVGSQDARRVTDHVRHVSGGSPSPRRYYRSPSPRRRRYRSPSPQRGPPPPPPFYPIPSRQFPLNDYGRH